MEEKIEKISGYLYKDKIYTTEEEAIFWKNKDEFHLQEEYLNKYHPGFLKHFKAGGVKWVESEMEKIKKFLELYNYLLDKQKKFTKREGNKI